MRKKDRPTQNQYFMSLAEIAATRSNCYRRQVGCIIIDKQNRIIGTGYNGVPRGYPHCKPGECPRENPGMDLNLCLAAHAEMNALIQCRDIDKAHKMYVTDSPCLPCTIVLLNTNIQQIMYGQPYPGAETPRIAWQKLGRVWVQHEAE